MSRLEKLARAHATASVKKLPSNAELRKEARRAELRHDGRRAIGNPDPRVVVGEVDAGRHGRLHLEHDQDAGELIVHGVRVAVADIDKDLRQSVLYTTAAFARAENDQEEQTAIRTLLGFTTAAILDRHQFIRDAVRQRQRDVRN